MGRQVGLTAEGRVILDEVTVIRYVGRRRRDGSGVSAGRGRGGSGHPALPDRPVRADQARFAGPLGTLSETARLAEQRARFFAVANMVVSIIARDRRRHHRMRDRVGHRRLSTDFQQSPAAAPVFQRHPISPNKVTRVYHAGGSSPRSPPVTAG